MYDSHQQTRDYQQQQQQQHHLPPPPPPPPPRPASSEPYGGVAIPTSIPSSSSSSSSHVRRRGVETDEMNAGDASSGLGLTPQPYASYSSSSSAIPAPPPLYHPRPAGGGTSYSASSGMGYAPSTALFSPPAVTHKHYQHNVAVSILLVPPLVAFLLFCPTSYPYMALLFATLILYALDLANYRDGVALGVWASFLIVTLPYFAGRLPGGLWDLTSYDDGAIGGGGGWGFTIFEAGVEVMLLFCLACWSTLQFRWLHTETPSFAVTMEHLLHSILPPTSACLVTYHLTSIVAYDLNWGIDTGATLAPYIFAAVLALGMYLVGSCSSSFQTRPDEQQGTTTTATTDRDDKIHKSNVSHNHAITPSDGMIHSALLLLVPPVMHVMTFRNRILYAYASFDDLYDLILVFTVPYLIHYSLLTLTDAIWYKQSLPNLLLFGTHGTFRGALFPMAQSALCMVTLQQRYVIPWCQTVSYLFNGHDVQSTALTSVYLSLGTVSLLACLWFFGRKSERTGQVLLGEYHEDVIQVLLVLFGFFLSLGCGLPWTLMPMPVLSFMSLALWATTRMFRYIAIFLFVCQSTLSIYFAYRFTIIDSMILTPVPGFAPTIRHYSMWAMFGASLLGAVIGLVLRSPGGYGATYLKKLDVPGNLLAIYGIFLTFMEFVLMKHPLPAYDDEETDSEDIIEENSAYDPLLSILTGLLLIGMAWHFKRVKLITTRALVVIVSTSVGKVLAVLIDVFAGDVSVGAMGSDSVTILSLRALVASVLLMMLFGPCAYLEPVHVKTSTAPARLKRLLGPSGKTITNVPKQAERTLFAYCAVLLPITLLVSIPSVLNPLIGMLSGHYSGAYYGSSPVLSEIVGYASSMWGLAVLSMTNHYLPDGGGELWKKVSALSFLMGLGVAFTAPTIPVWLWNDTHARSASPFASISSLGMGDDGAGRGKNGGWGLISACFATLLALTGPLELRERRDATGRRDKSLLLRLMVFSILFGCGVSWFITIQSMSDEEFLPIFLTATSCMAISFFGTVASVLGYFLELQSFDEVEQITKVCIGAFPIFLLIAGTSSFVEGAAHPYGIGGWLSTYLSVCGCVTLAFSLALRSRGEKSAATRGLGNLSCIMAWACSIIVLYGKFGLAGIDVSSGMNKIWGIPASVIGTFLVSPILLLLEGETTDRSSRTYRLSTPQQQRSTPFGINLSKLTQSNRLAPPVAGTAAILIGASLYAIFFRGCGWLVPYFVLQVSAGGIRNIHTSHVEVFKSVYGVASRTTGIQQGEDVASMAQKNLIHNQAVVTAARLSGSGFWTSESIFGPLLHLGGVVAVIPSLYFLVSHLWNGTKQPFIRVLAMLPLTIFPLVLCRGIPSLQAAALLGLVGGIIQTLNLKRGEWVGKMRI